MSVTRPARPRRITRAGLLVFFLIACMVAAAFVQRVNLLLALVCLWGTLLTVGQLAMRGGLGSLVIRSRPPRKIHARETFEWQVEVTNPGRAAALWVWLVGDATPPLRLDRYNLPVPTLPPGSGATLSFQGVFEKRGRHRSPDFLLTSAYPFGLFVRTRRHRSEEMVLVYPEVRRLADARSILPSDRWEGSRSAQRMGTPTFEVQYLREYRDGDDPRRIHWRTTARRGRPMVRQFESASASEIACVVDLSLGNPHDVEIIVSLAASLVVAWGEEGNRSLDLTLAGADVERMIGVADPRFVEQALAALAVAEAAPSETTRRHLTQSGAFGARRVGLLLATRPNDELTQKELPSGWRTIDPVEAANLFTTLNPRSDSDSAANHG